METKRAFLSDFPLRFQLKFSLLTLACLSASNLYLYNQYLRHDLGEGYFAALVTLSKLEGSLTTVLFMTFIVQSLVFLLSSLALILYFKRKLIGTIYRFDTLLRNIKDGDLQQVIQNRDSDQIKSLFSALTSLSASLSTVYSSISGVEKNLLKHVRQLKHNEKTNLQSLRQQIAQTRLLLGREEERK